PQPKQAARTGSEKAGTVGAGCRMHFPVGSTDMFVWRAIAIRTILRADAATGLYDLPCNTSCVRACSNDVTNMLRLADAARVATNHDDAPAERGFFLICCQVCPQES